MEINGKFFFSLDLIYGINLKLEFIMAEEVPGEVIRPLDEGDGKSKRKRNFKIEIVDAESGDSVAKVFTIKDAQKKLSELLGKPVSVYAARMASSRGDVIGGKYKLVRLGKKRASKAASAPVPPGKRKLKIRGRRSGMARPLQESVQEVAPVSNFSTGAPPIDAQTLIAGQAQLANQLQEIQRALQAPRQDPSPLDGAPANATVNVPDLPSDASTISTAVDRSPSTSTAVDRSPSTSTSSALVQNPFDALPSGTPSSSSERSALVENPFDALESPDTPSTNPSSVLYSTPVSSMYTSPSVFPDSTSSSTTLRTPVSSSGETIGSEDTSLAERSPTDLSQVVSTAYDDQFIEKEKDIEGTPRATTQPASSTTPTEGSQDPGMSLFGLEEYGELSEAEIRHVQGSPQQGSPEFQEAMEDVLNKRMNMIYKEFVRNHHLAIANSVARQKMNARGPGGALRNELNLAEKKAALRPILTEVIRSSSGQLKKDLQYLKAYFMAGGEDSRRRIDTVISHIERNIRGAPITARQTSVLSPRQRTRAQAQRAQAQDIASPSSPIVPTAAAAAAEGSDTTVSEGNVRGTGSLRKMSGFGMFKKHQMRGSGTFYRDVPVEDDAETGIDERRINEVRRQQQEKLDRCYPKQGLRMRDGEDYYNKEELAARKQQDQQAQAVGLVQDEYLDQLAEKVGDELQGEITVDGETKEDQKEEEKEEPQVREGVVQTIAQLVEKPGSAQLLPLFFATAFRAQSPNLSRIGAAMADNIAAQLQKQQGDGSKKFSVRLNSPYTQYTVENPDALLEPQGYINCQNTFVKYFKNYRGGTMFGKRIYGMLEQCMKSNMPMKNYLPLFGFDINNPKNGGLDAQGNIVPQEGANEVEACVMNPNSPQMMMEFACLCQNRYNRVLNLEPRTWLIRKQDSNSPHLWWLNINHTYSFQAYSEEGKIVESAMQGPAPRVADSKGFWGAADDTTTAVLEAILKDVGMYQTSADALLGRVPALKITDVTGGLLDESTFMRNYSDIFSPLGFYFMRRPALTKMEARQMTWYILNPHDYMMLKKVAFRANALLIDASSFSDLQEKINDAVRSVQEVLNHAKDFGQNYSPFDANKFCGYHNGFPVSRITGQNISAMRRRFAYTGLTDQGFQGPGVLSIHPYKEGSGTYPERKEPSQFSAVNGDKAILPMPSIELLIEVSDLHNGVDLRERMEDVITGNKMFIESTNPGGQEMTDYGDNLGQLDWKIAGQFTGAGAHTNFEGSGLLDTAGLQYPENVPHVQTSTDLEDEYALLAYSRPRQLRYGMKEETSADLQRPFMYRNFRRPNYDKGKRKIPEGGTSIVNVYRPSKSVRFMNVNGLPQMGLEKSNQEKLYEFQYGDPRGARFVAREPPQTQQGSMRRFGNSFAQAHRQGKSYDIGPAAPVGEDRFEVARARQAQDAEAARAGFAELPEFVGDENPPSGPSEPFDDIMNRPVRRPRPTGSLIETYVHPYNYDPFIPPSDYDPFITLDPFTMQRGNGYHGAGVIPHMRISRGAHNLMRKNIRNRPVGHARKGSANNLLHGEIQDVHHYPPMIPEQNLNLRRPLPLGSDPRTYTPRPEPQPSIPETPEFREKLRKKSNL